MAEQLKIVVVGAGIFGVTAAVELRVRGHSVTLLDPGPLPHPLAASTDISKVVRMAYGPDEDYTLLAKQAVDGWRAWNVEFGTELYHETGFLSLKRRRMKRGDFEFESFELLKRIGEEPERLTPAKIRKRYPAWNTSVYVDGIFHSHSGFAESGRVVARLVEKAKTLGAEIKEGERFVELDDAGDKVQGVKTSLGHRLPADLVLVAVGAWTPHVLPHTSSFFRSIGQPVFHLKPRQREHFQPPLFPVFSGDSSSTGFYGFPVNRDGVLKIASHGPGREMHPESPERQVTAEEEASLREFLDEAIPSLVDAPVTYKRVCLYCDSGDEDFWIAHDPDRKGLVVAAGDSGHGFKFAPVLGGLIADAVESKPNPLLNRFRWRPEVKFGSGHEASRYHPERTRSGQ